MCARVLLRRSSSHCRSAHPSLVSRVAPRSGRTSSPRSRRKKAVRELEPVVRELAERGFGEPAIVPAAPDLIEAYVLLGRRDDAERELASFAALAERSGRAWALGCVHRCRGLLGVGDGPEEFLRGSSCTRVRPCRSNERARSSSTESGCDTNGVARSPRSHFRKRSTRSCFSVRHRGQSARRPSSRQGPDRRRVGPRIGTG